jgi:hypothetical protein
MSKNKFSSGDGEGFLRATTDAWKDLELETGLHLSLRLSPTGRKGVMRVELQALEEDDMGITGVFASYATEYPSAAVSSLEATLYQSVIRLERVVLDANRWPSGRG